MEVEVKEVAAIEEEILSALPSVTTLDIHTHTGTYQLVLHEGTVREKRNSEFSSIKHRDV